MIKRNEISQKQRPEAKNEKSSEGSFNSESTVAKKSHVQNDMMDSSAAHTDLGSSDNIPSPNNSYASSLLTSKGILQMFLYPIENMINLGPIFKPALIQTTKREFAYF